MSMDHIAFLADGHLTRADGPRLEALEAALAGLEARAAAVYILGDLFEVWLGVKQREPHVARLARALERLRQRGARTVYVEGNRDFRIGRGATRGLFDVVATGEIVETFGAVTYHLSHGDLVNRRDRQYRAWRRLAKGLLAPAALTLLPDRVTIGLATRLEERLRRTNRAHKGYFPEDECRDFARERIDRGADVVVVGHFHHHVVLPVAGESRRGRFVSLPFWHDEPRPLLFDREGSIAG